uniref:Uncharacterized protein n=1 Tax=Arundo donax TaxID=35708 RepID=A0A0A9GER6_ARUDO
MPTPGTWSRWTTMWRFSCRRTITGCSPSTSSILPGQSNDWFERKT